MENNKIINGNCWVFCLDVIGFKRLLYDHMAQAETNEEVARAMETFVGLYYKEILRKLVDKGEYRPDKVFVHWFSDTFLLYTLDDSPECLKCIGISATHFFVEVIRTRIALRGALSFGDFYADKENGIFLGRAFIDAYEYAEKQDWIGLVISPKARSELQKVDCCPPDRGKWIEYDVPSKGKEPENLFSFMMGKHMQVEECIRQLQKEAENRRCESEYDRVKSIYENTLKFIKDTNY